MNTFLTIVIICGLLVGTSVLTFILTRQEVLKDFKNSLLEAKKENKKVSVIVDDLKILISSKDIEVQVL